MPLNRIKALTLDVFGTVVDWRGSIVNEGAQINSDRGWNVDWAAFADAWRALYQPSMSEVRDGKRPWIRLDDLHRESLETLIPQYGLAVSTKRNVNNLTASGIDSSRGRMPLLD